jgi:hypothetical protein
MTARYPLVLNTTSIQEIQVGDTYDLSQGASLPLATGVSGVLPVANGGTNLSAYTANGLLFASSTSVLAQSANLSFNSSTNILTVGSGITGGISGGTF